MTDIKLAPSILAADFSKLGQEVERMEAAGADWIHIDVMDGHFVPPITFGAQMVAALRKITRLPLDVHLMVEHPETMADAFIDAGADVLVIHAEATQHMQRLLSYIRQRGVKPGVSLNPATSLTMLEYVLQDVDVVLLMTVNPGYGGQTFIPAMVDKVARLRHMLDEAHALADIEVDGGITLNTAASVIDAGATILVAGSAIFTASDAAQAIRRLRGAHT